MSADNGIYILKTKDQYRVAHLQSIENVSRSAIDGDWQSCGKTRGKYVPTRVVEMWGRCKYTRDERTAFRIAHRWAERLPICEYGVNVITYNKTWRHISEDAKRYAKRELEHIKKCKEEHLWNTKRLQVIADGCYDRANLCGNREAVGPEKKRISSASIKK